MDVAIGLPNAVAGTKGEQLLEFARRADSAGFSSLGTIDRIVYDNYESLTTLAAAGAVTERIRLATTILILPYRANGALVAKQAATVNALSGGRLLLGLAVGGRDDDYAISGVEMSRRGELMDEMLETMEQAWESDAVGPPGRPEVVIGGTAPAPFRRAARYGSGWMLGGGTPDALREGKRQVEEAWERAGRDGRPTIRALGYYALGPNAEEKAREDLLHYYAWLGEDIAEQIASSAATTPEAVKGALGAFEDAECDEFFFFAADNDPEQVDLLAEHVL
jgi:alkanesulfonate monooxygenase SsuD/methylene tetrahydromethanopterin reductase-like flavin-dependent oxidoreductase (luciferase family)